MDIIEQIALVDQSWKGAFQAVLMIVCLVALAAVVVGAAVCLAAKVLTPVIEWAKRHGIQAALVSPFVLCFIWYGSTKESVGRVTYPYTDVETRYLVDAGSYVTNDYVHVEFVKISLVPESANFYGVARPCGSTNDADWVEFLATTFAAFHSPSNVPFAGAITNDFQFFTDYTPGVTTHTNGVAVVPWQKNFAGDGRYLATIRTGIYTNGFRVAPNPGITNGTPFSVTITNIMGDQENE